jgi:hypothetical protein
MDLPSSVRIGSGSSISKKRGNPYKTSYPKNWAAQMLKGIIRDEKHLLQIAFCFRINPTPLRKILADEPPSKYILNKLQKVQAELAEESDLNEFILNSERGRKLVSIYRHYQKEGSLGKVGQLMDLSRERVRQLLNKGTELGLFEYKRVRISQ